MPKLKEAFDQAIEDAEFDLDSREGLVARDTPMTKAQFLALARKNLSLENYAKIDALVEQVWDPLMEFNVQLAGPLIEVWLAKQLLSPRCVDIHAVADHVTHTMALTAFGAARHVVTVHGDEIEAGELRDQFEHKGRKTKETVH